MQHKLQYISQGQTEAKQIFNIQTVLDGGCQWIQLRFKNAPPDVLLHTAEKVKKICESFYAKLIINDFPVIAQKIDADGVHLGLDDMPVELAREIVGENKIIGGTANNFFDLEKHYKNKCSYVGVGPFRFTNTKEKLSPIIGMDGFKYLMKKVKENGIAMPVIAIGGIQLTDISEIISTGIDGIALSGALSNQTNTSQIIQQINSLVYANT